MVYIGTMNFIQKKTALNQFHALQKTGPRWSCSVPTISGSVLDWLRSMVAYFGAKNRTEMDLRTLDGSMERHHEHNLTKLRLVEQRAQDLCHSCPLPSSNGCLYKARWSQ